MNMYMCTEHTQSAALNQGEGHTNALSMYNPMVGLISRRGVLALWSVATALLWTSSLLVDGDMGRAGNVCSPSPGPQSHLHFSLILGLVLCRRN